MMQETLMERLSNILNFHFLNFEFHRLKKYFLLCYK